MFRDSVTKGNTALNVLGFERSKSWSRKMLRMFNFGGGGDLFSKEELDDLLDSGDGVVSRFSRLLMILTHFLLLRRPLQLSMTMTREHSRSRCWD